MNTTNPADAANRLFNVDATDTDILPEVMVAYDAVAAGHPDAYKLLVGLPATVGIGSDSYAHVVVKTTPKTITLDDGKTYRLTKRGWRNGSFRLSIGVARDYRNPSF